MKFQSNFIEGLQSLKFLANYNNNGAAERDLEKNNETYQMKKFNEHNNRGNSSVADESSSQQNGNIITRHMLEICLAETIGTFMLMFFGCMSLISGFNQTPVASLQSALMFGFVVSTVIVVFGHISGAHLNPSVTVAALVLGNISLVEAVIYVTSQCMGAILGYATLGVLTPEDILTFGFSEDNAICITIPNPAISDFQALLAEFLATSLVVLTCCGVWDHRNAHQGDAVPIKFALVVALCSVTVGPYTGASMNPARSLAPALVNGIWTKQWIYWTAPLLAGTVTPFIYRRVFERQELNRKSSSSSLNDDINVNDTKH